jgi:hypothetical protein
MELFVIHIGFIVYESDVLLIYQHAALTIVQESLGTIHKKPEILTLIDLHYIVFWV